MGQDAGAIDAGPPMADAGSVLDVPFDAPTPITELEGFSADDPSLTADLLEIFFNASGSLSTDIYRATRDSIDQPFGAAEVVDELSSLTAADSSPEVSGDGLFIAFSSTRIGGGGGGYDLFYATRADRSSPWGSPEPLTTLNTSTAESNPTVRPDGLRMVFVRGVPTAGFDIHEAVRASVDDEFTDLGPLAINTVVEDGGPMMALGGLVLFFHSQRPGSAGRDLYMARRPTLDDAFDDVIMVPGVNTAADEFDIWLSEDARTIFFSRDGVLSQASR